MKDYRGLLIWTIMGYYGLLWILDYHGIVIDSGLSLQYRGFWTVMVYHGLPWTMDYHALFGIILSWIIVGYLIIFAVSWMMDYRGLSWASVDYRGLL